MAATFEKHVVDEKLKKSASIDRASNNSPANRSDSNGVDSANQSRDGTPVDRRRSPTAQDTAKNTPPLSKQNSQSPKSKPSTPVLGQKRSDSTDEINDKVNNISISKNKSADQQNILSNRDEALTCQVNKKRGAGFKTDRDYLEEEHDDQQHDLEAWQPDPEHPYNTEEHIEDSPINRGRWTADDMFRANNKLGVNSTYNGIDEYSTAMPEGDEEARRRANEIANEIEGNKESQRNKMLENDDEERDLDKETRFDRENRNQKRQSSGGYQNKGNRSGGYNGGMKNDGRNYSNSPRNSYPNSGSGASSGSNRYGNTQSRQQRGPYSSNFSGTGSRQAAPTSTSWRTESPQQAPQQLSSVQTTNYAKTTAKSPSLHSDERRQSASPATSKYSTDSGTSIRRTNSTQNRQQSVQQPSYSPRPDSYAQGDRRVSDNRYYDGSTAASLPPTANQQQPSQPQIEVPPLITPIPRQANTPHSQSSYDTQSQQQYSNEPSQESASNEEPAEKPKKKFTFNPNAEVFVPKSLPQMKTTPVATPSAMPMQMGMPQHNQPVVMPNYNGQQMVQMSTIPMQMPQQLLVQPQGYPQSMAQQIPASMPVVQQRAYPTMDYVNNGKLMESAQQQKYVAAAPIPLQPHQMLGQPVQYITQNQYPQHMLSQQMPLNTVQHPQITGGQISYAANQTGMVSGSLPYQQAPPLVHQQQQMIYPTNYSYGGQ